MNKVNAGKYTAFATNCRSVDNKIPGRSQLWTAQRDIEYN